MKSRNSSAVCIFIGALMTVVFAVGIITSRNPSALLPPHRYDYALVAFCAFCRDWYLPAGISGIPLLLISLLISLHRERKESRR